MNKYLIKQIRKAIERNNYKIPNYIDTYNARPVNDVCITIATHSGMWGGIGSLMVIEMEQIPIKEATKKGYKIAKEGDGINISSRLEHQRGNVQDGLAQTLKTSCEVGVIDNGRERERERGLEVFASENLLQKNAFVLWGLKMQIINLLLISDCLMVLSTIWQEILLSQHALLEYLGKCCAKTTNKFEKLLTTMQRGLKMKSYKDMNYEELLDEELRIREICILKKGDMISQKQHRKHLTKIQSMLREYEELRYGKATTKYGV